ncbi:Z1 domain-containing protein [Sphingobacterium sp. HMA12]|uniref:Z1 domain-containing protein n=1 Tax=Sphingobacterium sp. HMA12 TaxID=2050894 RepID=UPI000CEA4A38|nr:Z1 domain-containing protein [Sphingobacterium sp. HMA12]
MNYLELIKALIKDTLKRYEKVVDSIFGEIKDNVFTKMEIISSEFAELDQDSKNHAYNIAVKEYLSVHPINIEDSESIVKSNHPFWLTEERKKEISVRTENYLERYLRYLKQKGRADKVVDSIRMSSESIMEKLGDPNSQVPFYCKGMVVGSVQSGKTGNFNAVINRSVDCGYKLIIVLSGIMEDLRAQTQERVEEEVIGYGIIDKKNQKKGAKGVGSISNFTEIQLTTPTSYKSDFKKTLKEADFPLDRRNILVCKKNSGVLKNLLLWLNEHLPEGKDKHDLPLLIVDDEADNASLNNLGKKGIEEASTINGHIRAILALFTKKSYLGYTATPFANVLADRNKLGIKKWVIKDKMNGEVVNREFSLVDNIYPDDFIELLKNPSNYIGAKQLFETVYDDDVKKLPIIETIYDYNTYFPERVVEKDGIIRPASASDTKTRAAKKTDPFPKELPESLKDAVGCFILSIALRYSRQSAMTGSSISNPHHTMLVHVSRFIPWQNKTKDKIQELINEITGRITSDLPTSEKSIYSYFQKLWYRYYAYIVENIKYHVADDYRDEFLLPRTFNELKHLLDESIKGINVVAVNSDTGDKLVYEKDQFGKGAKYIAVGGNRLSRGFTLEGLTINYFLRNTNFSDTLLQMGRWFGYRPGYLDCCKIFTTSDAVSKFDSTTRAIEELEIEFTKMRREGKQPKDYELRVRKHPGTLKITRPSILQKTNEVKWSYQDQLVQTTKFNVSSATEVSNTWDSFRNYFEGKNLELKDEFLLHRTDIKGALQFLDLPNNYCDFEMSSIIKFIELCEEKHFLKNWTIAIKLTGASKVFLETDETGLSKRIELTVRTGPKQKDTYYSDFINKGLFAAGNRSANIVSSGKDFSLLLTDPQKAEAKQKFINEKIEYYLKKGKGDSEKKALEKAEKLNPPERIYREEMSDQDGLIVVYLMDMKAIYLVDDKDQTKEMKASYTQRGFDKIPKVPLVGIAIGFPKIDPDPGGEYVVGDYDQSEDIGDEDDPDAGMPHDAENV